MNVSTSYESLQAIFDLYKFLYLMYHSTLHSNNGYLKLLYILNIFEFSYNLSVENKWEYFVNGFLS